MRNISLHCFMVKWLLGRTGALACLLWPASTLVSCLCLLRLSWNSLTCTLSVGWFSVALRIRAARHLATLCAFSNGRWSWSWCGVLWFCLLCGCCRNISLVGLL